MKSFSTVKGNVHITLDMSRFERQFQRAQYQLDGAVMESMVPFMPMITGSFINTTRAASAAVQGSGVVYAAYGPQGRFLYEGKGMVDEQTGSPWARSGAKKVLVSQYGGKTRAKEWLGYTKEGHPKAQAEGVEAAKKGEEKGWIHLGKEKTGGGRRG